MVSEQEILVAMHVETIDQEHWSLLILRIVVVAQAQ